MNLNDFVVFPNKPKSVKLSVRNLRELRMGTVHLAQENKDMESRLRQLREIMSQEKEEREKSGAFRWKSAQSTSLPSVPHCGENNKEKLSAGKMKIRVLKAEPLPESAAERMPEPPPRDTGLSRKPRLKAKPCGQCESRAAGLMCAECREDYCVGCFAKFHQKGALKYHRMIPVQAELQTSVSSLDVVNRFQRQVGEEGGRSVQPTQAAVGRLHTDTTETTAGHLQPLPDNQTHSKQVLFVNEGEEMRNEEDDGCLLKGCFDEEESFRSFQEALNEWRGRGNTGDTPNEKVPHQNKRMMLSGQPALVDAMGTQTVGSSQRPIHIEFKEHGLSYMEKLLLKIHRRTPIQLYQSVSARSPSMNTHSNSHSPAEKISELTVDEMGAYRTSLFAVSPPAGGDWTDGSSESCLSIVETDETVRDSPVDGPSGVKQGGDKEKSAVLSRPWADEAFPWPMEPLVKLAQTTELPLPLSPPVDHFSSVTPHKLEALKSESPSFMFKSKRLNPLSASAGLHVNPEPSDLPKLQTLRQCSPPNPDFRLPESTPVPSGSPVPSDSQDWGWSSSPPPYRPSPRCHSPALRLSSTSVSNLMPSEHELIVVQSPSPPNRSITPTPLMPSLYPSTGMLGASVLSPLPVKTLLSLPSPVQEVPALPATAITDHADVETDCSLPLSIDSADLERSPEPTSARLSPLLSISDESSDDICPMPTDEDSSDEEVRRCAGLQELEEEDDDKKEEEEEEEEGDRSIPPFHLSISPTESDPPLTTPSLLHAGQTAPPSGLFPQPSMALSGLAQRQSSEHSLYRGLDGYFTLGLDLSSIQTSPSPPHTPTESHTPSEALTGGQGSWRPASSLRHHAKEQLVAAVINSHPVNSARRSTTPTVSAASSQRKHPAAYSRVPSPGFSRVPSTPRPHTIHPVQHHSVSPVPRALSRAALEIIEVQSVERHASEVHRNSEDEEDNMYLTGLEEELRLMSTEPDEQIRKTDSPK